MSQALVKTSGTTTVVLGGGVGGLVTATELRKRLPAQHRIVLVDREEQHVFAPSLLWMMIGQRRPEQISRPLSRLNRKGIEVIRGEIKSIDAENRRVEVGDQTLTADYLVISLGADLAPAAIPGLAESGHNFYTVEGAQSLHQALSTFQGGKVVVMTAAPGYKCPAAPYEAAMLIEYYLRKRKLRDRTQVDLYAAEPGPMMTAGVEMSKAVRGMVESKNVTYHPEHQVKQVDTAQRVVEFNDGSQAPFDLLAYVPPHRAPKVVKDAGLTGESGWVGVDKHTLQTRFPQVYAIGDVVGIPLPMGKPLPKAGVFAHAQGEVVANNIALAITGQGKSTQFLGKGQCFVEIGDGRAGIGQTDFYAEPRPQAQMRPPGYFWHFGKVLFEKHWLWKWF